MLETTPLWIWHAILMTAGLVCIVCGGLLPVYGKNIAGWYRYHVMLGGVGGALIIIAVILGFDAVYLSGSLSLFFVHVLLGILLILTLAATLALASFRSRVAASRKAIVRSAHLWAGRFFIVLAVINIFLGLSAMGILA